MRRLTMTQRLALRVLKKGPQYGTTRRQHNDNVNGRVAASLLRRGLVEIDTEGVGSYSTRWRLTATGWEVVDDE